MTTEGAAQAQPNIALIKYWGKQEQMRNVPATPSLSVTLDSLWTRTRIRFDEDLSGDQLSLNDRSDDLELKRVSDCLQRIRDVAGTRSFAEVISENNFPTAAGVASSASGFAALVTAACAALQLDLDDAARSRMARMSSASAARSVFGGFVELQIDDDLDPAARPVLSAAEWPLQVLVVITSSDPKAVGSTVGMRESAKTSALYPAWVDAAPKDFAAAQRAISARDFEALTEVSETSCLKMHSVMLSTRPPLLYWNGTTVDVMHCIRQLRSSGVPVFFTIDAGPQVKAICLPGHEDEVEQAVRAVPGVIDVIKSGLGPGARTLEKV